MKHKWQAACVPARERSPLSNAALTARNGGGECG